jgi:hypothetical protein
MGVAPEFWDSQVQKTNTLRWKENQALTFGIRMRRAQAEACAT